MHIEPGVLNAAKVLYANVTAIGTLAVFTPRLIKRPDDILKTLLAAMFFSIFMEAFHLPIGASELHFVGASAVYFVFGFIPTLLGFAIGLLLQGLLFEPQDLVHLGVNSLSLMLPLITAHYTLGRRFFNTGGNSIRWAEVVKFDAMYYTGVVMMVGFWLSLGEEPTPFHNWALFALSYLPLVLCEPLFTCLVVRTLKRHADNLLVSRLTCVKALSA
ncbi:energy-coupling factor ABC transporter permease [Pseudomonas defluvii]|uniref:energy-coupling factor ABC transporter permease n=1 Tax=Pseudomonas defluvii TaxID=1876757 RepID=UPI003906A455